MRNPEEETKEEEEKIDKKMFISKKLLEGNPRPKSKIILAPIKKPRSFKETGCIVISALNQLFNRSCLRL